MATSQFRKVVIPIGFILSTGLDCGNEFALRRIVAIVLQ